MASVSHGRRKDAWELCTIYATVSISPGYRSQDYSSLVWEMLYVALSFRDPLVKQKQLYATAS